MDAIVPQVDLFLPVMISFPETDLPRESLRDVMRAKKALHERDYDAATAHLDAAEAYLSQGSYNGTLQHLRMKVLTDALPDIAERLSNTTRYNLFEAEEQLARLTRYATRARLTPGDRLNAFLDHVKNCIWHEEGREETRVELNAAGQIVVVRGDYKPLWERPKDAEHEAQRSLERKAEAKRMKQRARGHIRFSDEDEEFFASLEEVCEATHSRKGLSHQIPKHPMRLTPYKPKKENWDY